ncbi:hypothetical protein AN286_05400 [Aliarcobacter cryaerophilus ATCC 43158]|uniref:Membrane protein n=1 Tax=Aliarcobacter cryaerophilus ATCC 43158 TaxID=1032070 RepID=A0AAD0TV86_9BACT|nr:hypothetical protein [Aliarcobacter cryaerophilus]AYJ79605.1 putative membrane protein [Aliarcobacter cryaerophilus ATCC 43158]PRM95178.1 hypothetical protein CJ667_09120 [Aliarcobacter cryaerophilus]QCZ23850.1 hypothetical protein AN286_05400 [Aliarcobacter cryaerophilus ATCC 43158]
MELMTDRVIFYYIFFSSIIILLTMLWGLTKYKKLTNFQRSNRNNFVIKQGIILVVLIAISMGLNHILTFTFEHFQNNISQTESIFKFQVFATIGLVFLVVNYFYNRKLELVDERVVKLNQETPLFNFSSVQKIVKKIKDYSHFYSGITYDYSPKDFTIQNVTINISKADMEEFNELQDKQVQINQFYSKLIEYINLKSETFDYKKISDEDLQQIKTVKTLKFLIITKFEIFKENQYFPSISQLFQIANPEETEFLNFLRDYSHDKYSSLSLKHAIFYIKEV